MDIDGRFRMIGVKVGAVGGTEDFVYFLDEFPGSVIGCALWLLKKDYSGGLIRCHAYDGTSHGEADILPVRSSDGYVLSMDSKLENLDATAIGRGLSTSHVLGDLVDSGGANYNGLVPKIFDQDGTNHPAQTVTADQPEIINSGNLILSNGKPAIQWTAANKRLTTPTMNVPAARTYISVCERMGASFGANHNIILQNIAPFYQLYAPSSTNDINYYNGVNQAGNSFDLAQQILFLRQSAANCELFKNGVLDITSSGATTPINAPFNIGSHATYGMNAKLSNLFVYPTDEAGNRGPMLDIINEFYETHP